MLHDVPALPWIAGHNDAMSLHFVTLTGLREVGKWRKIKDHDAVPTHSSLPTLRLQRLSIHCATHQCSVVHKCLLSLSPSPP